MGGVPDFRVGGDFVIYVEPSGQTALWAGGSVRLREPGYRVVFTYAWTSRDLRLNGRAVPADPTIVQVTVRPEGDHSKVSVDHQGVPVELAVHVQALWVYYLPRLGPHAHGRHPGHHPWVHW